MSKSLALSNMQFIKRMPTTLLLIVINCIVFLWTYLLAGSFDEPLWTLGLLQNGALYNPFVFGGEWYRIFTQMFLHGGIWHLAFNMYGLFVAGQIVESSVGTKKFLAVYFIGGIAGALLSLYLNLFVISVGASAAIFSAFSFALILNIIRAREENLSIAPIIINFAIFLVITALFAEVLHADSAAHIGGALCGLLIGLVSVVAGRPLRWLTPVYVIASILFISYFTVPRYQYHYFNFFQEVLTAEDSTRYVLNNSGGKSNAAFLKEYRHALLKWDTAQNYLHRQTGLPPELHSDSMSLSKVITYRIKEGNYRVKMIENESYIYADSIEIASDSIGKYSKLDFVLNMKYTPRDTTQEEPDTPPLETVKIYYDSNWVEIPYPPAAYFRIGQRDSAGKWQGPLGDYFRNGSIQMKGSYKNDLKDGIFIYYSENKRYLSAGVYDADQRVGKWETFHPNGKIESEIFYRDRYFLKSYWDSTGVQMVKDGSGKEMHRHPNGVIASEGEYVDGYQQGYWYGRHANGEMYFEENYNRGRLINGRSKSKSGKTFVYDETTLYALPQTGFKALNDYLLKATADETTHGTVKLSFRVTVSGQLTDFKVEQSASKELDDKARLIILSGPRWLPAKLHGQETTDGYGFVSVIF